MTTAAEPNDDDVAVLDAASGVLGPFFEALFRAELRRLRGAGDGVAPEPPRALRAFGNFTPAKAVVQAGVRGALLELLRDDAELWPLLAEEFGDSEVSLAATFVAASAADRRGLEAQASGAAAHRPAGWGRIVAAATAAVAALDAAAGTKPAKAAADGGDRRQVEKLTHKLERSEAARVGAQAELAALKDRQAGLRRKLDAAQAAAEAAQTRATLAEAEAAAVSGRLHETREALEAARRSRRRTERDAQDAQVAAQAEIAALRAARIPDLEPAALALEQLAAQLRHAGADVHRAADTFDEIHMAQFLADTGPSGPADVAAGSSEVADGAAAAVPRRRPPSYPPGVRAGTVEAVQAVLGDASALIVVDGYNVIRQQVRGWGGLDGPSGRDLLVARCASARGADGAAVRIVFDSADAEQAAGRRQPVGVWVEFSGGPIADDRIVDVVGAQPPAQAVVVVTSDRELTGRVEALGADTVRSDVFLEAVGAPPR